MATTTKGYTVNFEEMSLPELKAEAKKRDLAGRSTMKKVELIEALKATEPAKAESFIDTIKAAFANARQDRANKGRKAGAGGTLTLKTLPAEKAMAFRLQRGSVTAKLTKKQERRIRKSERKAAVAG